MAMKFETFDGNFPANMLFGLWVYGHIGTISLSASKTWRPEDGAFVKIEDFIQNDFLIIEDKKLKISV